MLKKKTLIIYKSKYGASKDYARLVGEKLNIPFFSVKEVSNEMLKNAERILFFSGTFASRIHIAKYMKSHSKILKDKDTVLIFNGITPFDKPVIDGFYIGNFKGTIFQNRAYFYLPGRLDIHELHGFDKFIINMLISSIEKKPEDKRSNFEKGILDLKNKEIDNVKSDNIAELVEYVEHED